MFFLNIFRSLLLEVLLHYIVLLHSISPSTCLLSSFVLEFLSPFPQLFDFLGVKVVAAFSLDISVFLSLPCTFVVYLRRWSFLEGGLG